MRYFILFLLIFSFSIQLSAQNFPIGLYVSQDTIPSNDMEYIKQLKVDFILNSVRNNVRYLNSSYPNFIATDYWGAEDYIQKYSHAYYSIWEAENVVTGDIPGFKLGKGVLGSDCIASPDFSNEQTILLISGPDYQQEHKYPGTWFGDTLKYKVQFFLKRGAVEEDLPEGIIINNETPICTLQIIYKYSASDSIIIKNSIIRLGQLGMNYNPIEMSYELPEKVYRDYKTPNLNSTTQPSEVKTYGIKFNVIWNKTVKLFLDKVVISDVLLGSNFIDSIKFADISTEICRQIDKYPYVNYWAGLDEPNTIDHFLPYKMIQEVIKNKNKKMVSALYPGWDNNKNNEGYLQRFVNTVNPMQFMYYYYPYWTDKAPDCGIYFQKVLIDNAKGYLNSSWFVPQAYSYTSSKLNYRFPTPKELSSTVMLALASGSKGIFYYNYYSYVNSEASSFGIMSLENAPTNLYYEIKDNLNSRLKGVLGNTLLKLNFKGDIAGYRKTVYNSTESSPLNNMIMVNFKFDTIVEPVVDFFATMLKDDTSNITHYFVTNSIATSPKTAKITITKPSDSFINYRIKDVEYGLFPNRIDTSFAGSITINDNISAGDGHLLGVYPVVTHGGNLLTHEIIPYYANKTYSLLDKMTILNNVVLKTENKYYIKEDILLKPGARITTGLYGYLFIEDTAKVTVEGNFKNLVPGLNNKWNPKIVWAKYPGSSLVQYKVFKKYGNSNWQQIGTTNKTEYIDTNTVVFVYQGQTVTQLIDIKYKVDAYDYIDEIYMLKGKSDTITYKQKGAEIEKAAGTSKSELSYSLAQNYPNPFNPETNIIFTMADTREASIIIYDVLGNKIDEIFSGIATKGEHKIKFDSRKYNLNSGIYFYTLSAGGFQQTKKMLLIK